MAVKLIDAKRGVRSLLLGGGFALLPCLFDTFPVLWPSRPLDTILQQAFGFLSLPGLVVGLIFAGGNVHDYSLFVVSAANVFVYSLVVYRTLQWKHNRSHGLKAN
jgi:hypothetical protein